MRENTGSPASAVLWIRSWLFYVGLISITFVYGMLAIFTFPIPYAKRFGVVSQWAHANLWWLKFTCNLDHQIEGWENIPETPTIVLSKHQSAWETLALNLVFQPQVWVLKRELLRIPVFGWGLAMLRPIAIDRRAKANAVEQVLIQGRARLESGCWVVIFPEGTRVAAGTRRRYLVGGARLAERTGYPVVPVAHNAGDYWARNSVIKKPGRIKLVVGPVIESKNRRASELNRLVETWIETKVAEIRAQDGHDNQLMESEHKLPDRELRQELE